MSLQRSSVLIVDDEAALRRTLGAVLTAGGFAVEEARNGEEALRSLERHPVDLVLLDINMPGLDGIATCRRIRDLSPDAGIVMVTVRELGDDKVSALEAGADDYVTKPFQIRELTARLRAVLRRTRVHQPAQQGILQIGEMRADPDRRLVWKRDAEIHLSPKEFELLVFLMKNCGAPLPHAKVLRSVWGPEYGGELEYLRSYIRLLRKKIESNPGSPEYIVTEPWVGYRFRDPSES
jgi:two-component system, OmpR family, KDP operon response regulator KdpE